MPAGPAGYIISTVHSITLLARIILIHVNKPLFPTVFFQSVLRFQYFYLV
jgi:hypothetical protein